MKTELKAWGNSQGIRIPKSLMDEADLHVNDELNIEIKDGNIIITKTNKKLSLKERIEKYGPIRTFEEFDWGNARGSEIW